MHKNDIGIRCYDFKHRLDVDDNLRVVVKVVTVHTRKYQSKRFFRCMHATTRVEHYPPIPRLYVGDSYKLSWGIEF